MESLRIRTVAALSALLLAAAACVDGSLERPGPEDEAPDTQEGETAVVLSDAVPEGERGDLEIVHPGAEDGGDAGTVDSSGDKPATFVAARSQERGLRYIGVVPPAHSGTFELGPESTAAGAAFLPMTMLGHDPETQGELLDRLKQHPKFDELREAVESAAREHEGRPPFGSHSQEVLKLASRVSRDLLENPSAYADSTSENQTAQQSLKIGSFCAADRRLSCHPERCEGGKSGITDLRKGVKYCVGSEDDEVILQNPKTVYYGLQTTAPDGSVRDTSLMEGKGGLLQGFAAGPPVSNIRAKACDQITICQDFGKLTELGSGDPCAIGASANTFKAFAISLAMIMTGSNAIPGSNKIQKFGKHLRKYAKLLQTPKSTAIILAFSFTAQALDKYDTNTDRIYIDIPGGGTAGPIDIDDVQEVLQFIVNMSKIVSVTPRIQDAKRWNDLSDWKRAIDDFIVKSPGSKNSGGLIAGAKGLALGAARRVKSSAGSKAKKVFSHKHVNAKTVTTAVGAIGTIGLIAELRDGDIDFSKYARLVSMALEDLPNILADLGVGFGDEMARTLAVSLLSMSIGAKSADLAWVAGDRLAPFVYDLTVGGFGKMEFSVPDPSGGSCAPSCEDRCSARNQECGSIAGCPDGACGTCSGAKTCSAEGTCVQPVETCSAAQSEFESALENSPEVGVTDMLSGVEDVWSRLEEGSRASKEFEKLAKCVLSECRNAPFPRSCYRRAVNGGACSDVCTDRSESGANCSIGELKVASSDDCSNGSHAVFRCAEKTNSAATHWVELGCQCDVGGVGRGICRYGYESSSGGSCTAPGSHTSRERACDGGDGFDNDCDGDIDESKGCNCQLQTYYRDRDGDGYGTRSETVEACQTPSRDGEWATNAGDCTPQDPEVHPGHAEYCDGIDNDCDGDVDEGCDRDGDGYCKANRRVVGAPPVCPEGGGDCADRDSSIHPDGAPQCDGRDNDCDGRVDEKDPVPKVTTAKSHSSSEAAGWSDDKNRVVSVATDDGVCAAFLDQSESIEFAHLAPGGSTTSHTQKISGADPAELLEMEWSGSNCGLIYRRKDKITPNDNLYLARWNPNRPSSFTHIELTNDTFNDSGDAGFTGLTYIPTEGWVASWVATTVTRDNLKVGTLRHDFAPDDSIRETRVTKLNVDPLGPWPSIDVGPAPGSPKRFALAVASRWGSQYQIRVYTGRGTNTTRHSNLDIPYPNAGQYARVQLESADGTTYLHFHDSDADSVRFREIRDTASGPDYGRTDALSTGSRNPRPPTNLLAGGGDLGIWYLDPREDRAYTVQPSGSGFRFVPQDHPDLGQSDNLQTLYRDTGAGTMYAFSLAASDPYRTELTGYACY